ncbi:BnaCnng75450D, partial [Brassica napus]
IPWEHNEQKEMEVVMNKAKRDRLRVTSRCLQQNLLWLLSEGETAVDIARS